MAHHIYHTHALVLRSIHKGEANKILVLYTKELGLIFATAQGLRLAKSKLRYALSDYSYARVDLVRGKEVWRVTSAMPLANFAPLIRQDRGGLFLSRVTRLLERLLPGEEGTPLVFDDVLTAFYFLLEHGVETGVYEATELSLVLRVLKHLGYVGSDERYAPYIGESFDPSVISFDSLAKKTIIFEINRALRESQL